MHSKRVVLVTGGAGFIGSHLIEALLNRGDTRVYSIDNYLSGSTENHVAGDVTYIRGETCHIAALWQDLPRPEVVFHLGEYSRVEASFQDIKQVWRSNGEGTFHVVEFCRAQRAKLIYAGSSTRFAERENGNPVPGRDQSPYAWLKATNVELIQNFRRWFGLECAVAYFYNVYGEREITSGDYATVIGIFRRRYLAGEALQIVKPGTQKRNFTHVSDVVRGILLVDEKGTNGEYPLGAEEAYTIDDVARMWGGPVEYLEERPGNRADAKLDTTKARALGWFPTETLPKYIERIRNSRR